MNFYENTIVYAVFSDETDMMKNLRAFASAVDELNINSIYTGERIKLK